MHGTQLITQLLNEDRMSHTENNLKFHCGFCTFQLEKPSLLFMTITPHFMEFILVTCAVLHHLTCWHALFHHGMYNCQWQPVCVRIKCCSNTSTHVQFIQAKTHFSTIEHKRHGQQHCNAQKCKTISFMFLWLKTHLLCVDSLVGSVGVCSYAHVVCSTSYTPLFFCTLPEKLGLVFWRSPTLPLQILSVRCNSQNITWLVTFVIMWLAGCIPRKLYEAEDNF